MGKTLKISAFLLALPLLGCQKAAEQAPAEVIRQMEQVNVQLMIHGHTHRPARHALIANNKPAERMVLGDWHDHAWCIRANPQQIALINWPIS